MNLYQNPHDPDHTANCAAFLRVVNAFPELSFFQPSPDKAPWHWQAIVDLGRDPQLLNFWPHTGKAQREGFKSVEGEAAMRGIVEAAIADAQDEPFDVIEG